MKTRVFSCLIVPGLLALGPGTVRGDIYTDATGDFTGGVGALDIVSVQVNNDNTWLTFDINLNGDPSVENWYNYYIGICKPGQPSGGNLNASGGWGKDIQMSQDGMDVFVGAYPYYSGGYSILVWDGSSWSTVTRNYASLGSTSVTIPILLTDLGLNIGDTIVFDVWTSTSGSDYVLDALSDSESRWWNQIPFDTGANGLVYTLVPEPGVAAMGLIAAVVILFARRKR